MNRDLILAKNTSLFLGSSQITKLHCRPRPKAKHCKRLLGNDLVGKFVNCRHAMQLR